MSEVEALIVESIGHQPGSKTDEQNEVSVCRHFPPPFQPEVPIIIS
jgi:hypothetical protein